MVSGGPLPSSKKSSLRGLLLKIGIPVLGLAMGVGLTFFLIYGTHTKHKSRATIWWSERGRNLIPPAATEIILRQDFLDHYAIYRVSEKDLNVFLDQRFAASGNPLNSFSERRPVESAWIGKTTGPMGWKVTASTVFYSFSASNGGTHNYYHDTATGLTYQESAYW